MLSHDAATHTYRIDGRVVPSVTRVLRDVLPPSWQSSGEEAAWYMQRGRAVHAAAALIARDRQFDADPAIVGYVAAIRAWWTIARPAPIAIEEPVYSRTHQYAGTPDLVAAIQGRRCVIDYKSGSADYTARLQVAAYAMAMPMPSATRPRLGLIVELREDGTYRSSEMFELARYGREWLAVLTTYRIRQRMGLCCVPEEGT